MEKFIEVTGENRDRAIENGLRQLGLDRDDVSVEIIDNGKKGFLGIGATPAKVRLTYQAPDEVKPVEEKKEQVKPAAAKPVQEKKEEKKEKLSITTEDTTPRLVKAAPKNVSSENKPKREEAPRRERKPREERIIKPSVPKERELIPVSEEGMKKAEQVATEFVVGLLKNMGIEATVSTLEQIDCDQLRLEIAGPDMGPVIGRRGDTLDAIQYLGSLVLNNALDEHVRLSVDTENYRAKRMESLERLARKMAMKVQKTHRSMTLEAMNPYERRIIHAALQDFNGITTYSTGTEPGRRVVIAPERSRR